MKPKGVNGEVFTRLDAIKQSILLFMNAKLSINPHHRFAFCALGQSTFWLQKEFSSTFESALTSFRKIRQHSFSGQADLTQLFMEVADEAKKSHAENRILRLVLLYCRSSVVPHHQWPVTKKLFTLDVLYLHDKPESNNCPQKVYDALVDALEQVSEYEGYIFESGQGLPRIVFRHMCVLLSHPQQRYVQDDIDIPKSLKKKTAAVEKTTGGAEIEQVHLLKEADHELSEVELSGAEAKREMDKVEAAKEADHERPQVELSGAEAELEMAKVEAAKAFEEGYSACMQKFTEAGVDISGWSFADIYAELEEVYGQEANPSDSAIPA
ncbi:hypothetical protein AgCh_023896 [Apium graveolens]